MCICLTAGLTIYTFLGSVIHRSPPWCVAAPACFLLLNAAVLLSTAMMHSSQACLRDRRHCRINGSCSQHPVRLSCQVDGLHAAGCIASMTPMKPLVY